MLTIRKSKERGHANHGWLDSYHTFSFASYHDPNFMGFRSLRVINDDRIEAAEGFGTHPHRDMEILTYMLDGELEHRDSMGNGRIIKTGEVQGMSAGTGVTHSEFNASKTKPAHLLQMWIVPDTKNITPSYGEWLPDGSEKNDWALVASASGEHNSITIQQDARMYVATPEAGKALKNPVSVNRFGWLQVGTGGVELDGKLLQAGDGAAFTGDAVKTLTMRKGGALVLFDLA